MSSDKFCTLGLVRMQLCLVELCAHIVCRLFWFQARIFVARGAQTKWARGGIPDKSLLEVLPNPYAGGHILPASHNGARLCWAREYSLNPSFFSFLFFADSAKMPFSVVSGSEPQVHVFTENHFILFHAGLEIEMKTYWEITKP